jgi:hypothetical protein
MSRKCCSIVRTQKDADALGERATVKLFGQDALMGPGLLQDAPLFSRERRLATAVPHT